MIYSASYIWAEYKFNDPFKFVKHQGLFFIIGIIMMLITSKIPYKVYFEKANTLLLISIILLILVIIPGIGTVRNGSRSWFGIGSFGIQPSEFAKLTLIIFTSKYLTKNEKNLKYISEYFKFLPLSILSENLGLAFNDSVIVLTGDLLIRTAHTKYSFIFSFVEKHSERILYVYSSLNKTILIPLLTINLIKIKKI